jgi:hypothetical protein
MVCHRMDQDVWFGCIILLISPSGGLPMDLNEKVDLKLTLVPEPNVTLRNLETMRAELYDLLRNEFLPAMAAITPPSSNRSLDPAVVGALSLAVLPVAIDKLADLVMKYAEMKKDCLVKITIPLKGRRSAEITYNPKTTSKAALNAWINTAVEAAKSNSR